VNDPPPAAISDERYRRCDEIREVRDEIAASDRLRLRGVLAALDLGFRGRSAYRRLARGSDRSAAGDSGAV